MPAQSFSKFFHELSAYVKGLKPKETAGKMEFSWRAKCRAFLANHFRRSLDPEEHIAKARLNAYIVEGDLAAKRAQAMEAALEKILPQFREYYKKIKPRAVRDVYKNMPISLLVEEVQEGDRRVAELPAENHSVNAVDRGRIFKPFFDELVSGLSTLLFPLPLTPAQAKLQDSGTRNKIEISIKKYLIERIIAAEISENPKPEKDSLEGIVAAEREPASNKIYQAYLAYKNEKVEAAEAVCLKRLKELIIQKHRVIAQEIAVLWQKEQVLLYTIEIYLRTRKKWELENPGKKFKKPYRDPTTEYDAYIETAQRTRAPAVSQPLSLTPLRRLSVAPLGSSPFSSKSEEKKLERRDSPPSILAQEEEALWRSLKAEKMLPPMPTFENMIPLRSPFVLFYLAEALAHLLFNKGAQELWDLVHWGFHEEQTLWRMVLAELSGLDKAKYLMKVGGKSGGKYLVKAASVILVPLAFGCMAANTLSFSCAKGVNLLETLLERLQAKLYDYCSGKPLNEFAELEGMQEEPGRSSHTPQRLPHASLSTHAQLQIYVLPRKATGSHLSPPATPFNRSLAAEDEMKVLGQADSSASTQGRVSFHLPLPKETVEVINLNVPSSFSP